MPLPTTTHGEPRVALPRGREVARTLRCRLAALRAALESIGRELPAGDAHAVPVAGALMAVERLGHDVSTLLAWSLPDEVALLDATLAEIGTSAVLELPSDRRASTLFASEGPAARVRTDPAIASRAIARLIECGLAHGSAHAGLQAAETDEGGVFTLSFDAEADADATEAPCLELGRSLAHRDLARLGARVTDGPDGSVVVLLPHSGNRS